jgi:DNA-binding NarL/FixJ family response regulator
MDDIHRSQCGFTAPLVSEVFPMNSTKAISVLCIEDHPIFRDGLSIIIGSQTDMMLAAQATTAKDGVADYMKQRPDITLLDIRLPDADGLSALAEIRAANKEARVIILTTSDHEGDIQRALRAGASAYILKSSTRDEILSTIRRVYRHGKTFSPAIAMKLAEHMGEEQLTTRELEVLCLIRDGHRNKQIADVLCIAETTVNFHVKNLVDKLEANDRTHAVTIAMRRGLLNL